MNYQPLRIEPCASPVDTAILLYPEALRGSQRADSPRIAFQVDLISSVAASGSRVMDVGGGIGAFAPALSLAGYRVTLVDDFADPVNAEHPLSGIGVHDRLGVETLCADASSPAFEPEPEAFAAVTCIDSIEHWHRSPKASLHRMVAALEPGGALVLGLPNAVNLRKRVTVPLGRNNWSPFSAWYDEPVFRSHVREADVQTLRNIARDLGLERVRIIGRNWAGTCSPRRPVRSVARALDPLLRLRPSLCSDLYLIGHKS